LTPGSEGSTFGGYPLACVVAVAAIKAVVEGQLSEKARRQGERLIGHFQHMQATFPDKIKAVRGRGLLTAFELHDQPGLSGKKISAELIKRGVYVKETHETSIRVAPALTITDAAVDRLASMISDVVQAL
jgi:ornithine--oxo-acid transaminase